LPVVGLAFTGLSSGTLTLFSDLSRISFAVVLSLMTVAVVWFGWRAGSTPGVTLHPSWRFHASRVRLREGCLQHPLARLLYPSGVPDSERRVVRTMCPMNCHPTLCGMRVEVEDGQVVRITSDEENPDSRGFLCIRGAPRARSSAIPIAFSTPLVREARGAEFRRATWDEVLDRIVGRMQAVGPEGGDLVRAWALRQQLRTRLHSHIVLRFANFYGCQWWSPTIICWGLGAFGLGLTGVLETNTKEDMAEHSQLIVLWGANLASQPNTARHLDAAKRRGAFIVTVDVRQTEAAARSDEVLLLRPGTDAALALGMMQVIVAEHLHDREFVARHTLGFDQLSAHLSGHSLTWAAGVTGIAARRRRGGGAATPPPGGR
jgi:anaerobic selenocysteine-containing dehydrogenase